MVGIWGRDGGNSFPDLWLPALPVAQKACRAGLVCLWSLECSLSSAFITALLKLPVSVNAFSGWGKSVLFLEPD